MNKELRLEIIREAYHRVRENKKPLTPESLEILRILRQENDMPTESAPEPEVAVGYLFGVGQQDIEEEIQLCGTHYKSGDSEWEYESGSYQFAGTGKTLTEYLN